jgi:hypothetical protein
MSREIIDLPPTEWRFVERKPPPPLLPDREPAGYIGNAGNPSLVPLAYFPPPPRPPRKESLWWFDDSAPGPLIRPLAFGLFGQPFDFMQWVLSISIATYIFHDPDGPKGVGPLAVVAFAWFWARVITGSTVLTWRGLRRLPEAIGRRLGFAAQRDY